MDCKDDTGQAIAREIAVLNLNTQANWETITRDQQGHAA